MNRVNVENVNNIGRRHIHGLQHFGYLVIELGTGIIVCHAKAVADVFYCEYVGTGFNTGDDFLPARGHVVWSWEE